MQSPFRVMLRSVARPSTRSFHSTVNLRNAAPSQNAGEAQAAEPSNAGRAAKQMNDVPLDMEELSISDDVPLTLPPGIKGAPPPSSSTSSSSSSRGPGQRQNQPRRLPHLSADGRQRNERPRQQGQQNERRFGPGGQGGQQQRNRDRAGPGGSGAGGARASGRPGQGRGDRAGPNGPKGGNQRGDKRSGDRSAGGSSSATSSSKAIGTRSSGPPPEAKVTEDRTFGGIFGRASLVQPQPVGVRDAEASPRLAGLDNAAKRKALVHGMAGSYDLYMPKTPLPTSLPSSATPQQRAISAAEYAMAVNRSISLQAAQTARPVLEKYLGQK